MASRWRDGQMWPARQMQNCHRKMAAEGNYDIH